MYSISRRGISVRIWQAHDDVELELLKAAARQRVAERAWRPETR